MALTAVEKDRVERILNRAILKRNRTDAQVTILYDFAQRVEKEVDVIPLFRARINDLETHMKDFHTEQDAILDHLIALDRMKDFTSLHDSVETSLMEKYYFIKAIAQATGEGNSPTSVVNAGSHINLPKIALPQFNGDFLHWRSFRDTFLSLVHKNQNLSNIERFHYLVAAVTGTASPVVCSVPLTDVNYSVAWDALCDRFDNTRLIIHAHLDKIFGFVPLSSDNLPGLQRLLGVFQENIAAVNALELPDLAGFLLFYVASRALDPSTRQLFEAQHMNEELPVISDLLTFVQTRCQILQNSSTSSGLSLNQKIKPNNRRSPVIKSSFVVSSSDNTRVCPKCQKTHSIYKCDEFKQLSPSQRLKFVKLHTMCTNCLSTDHTVSKCTSKYYCRQCSDKHHSLLHLDTRGRQSSSLKSNDTPPHNIISSPSSNEPPSSVIVGATCSSNFSVLSTAVIRIRDRTGHWILVRALVDSGSQISAITTSCASRLGLIRSRCHTTIIGISQCPVANTKGVTTCTFVPRSSTSPQITCKPIILSNLTGILPSTPLDPNIRNTYKELNFADPNFDCPGPVEFLLGADVYNKLFVNGFEVRHSPGLPSAFETILGWILVGTLSTSISSSTPVSLLLTTIPTLESLLRQFWEIEQPIASKNPFTEEQHCEILFRNTTIRDSNGRYSVSLPFRENPALLGESRHLAEVRFYNLERKLLREPDVCHAYSKFMEEYEQLGHMHRATNPGKYFIPHHAVTKWHDGELKLRVVFDASARSSSGRSLNDLLYVGPKLQQNITDLLFRCRLHKFMFTADICKMYRQININSDDRAYQHIFWRKSPSSPLQEFELATVTYGVSASPFQALRVLHQLELDHNQEVPHATNVLSSQTYVDDIITGADTISKILRIQQDVIHLLAKGGFQLKKWTSNCSEILEAIPGEDHATALSFDPKDDLTVKILGLHWDPKLDMFSYHTSIMSLIYTKRAVLAAIARLYDPIGALAPITFWAKCFMQSLWQGGYDWDTPLSEDDVVQWKSFAAELHLVSSIKFHRHIPIEPGDDVQLLGFSDASVKGYSTVIYIRVTSPSGISSIHFFTSKSKVAPIKITKVVDALTIPRLELCGALLLAQVMHRIQQVLQPQILFSSLHAWTDSTIVLSWLTSRQVQFKIFVTNRLTKINELIPECKWRHVRSENNPADCVSRGLFPSEAINHRLYWDGPQFLTEPEKSWEVLPLDVIPSDSLLERSRAVDSLHIATKLTQESSWLEHFSTLTRMKRTIAYMHRFIARVRHIPSFSGFIRHKELVHSMKVVVRITQCQYFHDLFNVLSSPTDKVTPRSLACLVPFLDDEGIIRVGGRLRRSDATEDFKCPILLPKSCALTILLIRHCHIQKLHAGPQLVASLLSSRYWILSGRSMIRHLIFKCVTCARHRASNPQPIMGDLPSSRVRPSRPFNNVGIDYAGPFLLKEGKRKNARAIKCYLAIFVCMAVKAVHIEVVSDLTTVSFIAALHRFVSRRGIPTNIYSDCGTNFQGADRELRHLMSDNTAQNLFTNEVPCQWHFNPPAAPHFGGLWEAAVKSTKYHLKRVIGTQMLTFEEMCTLTQRIEAVLNSRPLTPQSSDPNDLRALTPGDFLIGCPLVAVPEPDITTAHTNRLPRWQLVTQSYQSFWKRWSVEYLTTLQGRSKWYRKQSNISIGDLVVIQTPNLPPTSWKLGRVELTHPGDDGVIRVVTVRTAEGLYKRPVVKLTVLPVYEDS